MSSHGPTAAVLCVALICLSIASLGCLPGCSSEPTGTPSAGPSQPGPGGFPAHIPQGEGTPVESTQSDPPVTIELSEPEAKLVLKFLKNSQGEEVPVRVVRWKVKYHFTQGQPQAGSWYTAAPSWAHCPCGRSKARNTGWRNGRACIRPHRHCA